MIKDEWGCFSLLYDRPSRQFANHLRRGRREEGIAIYHDLSTMIELKENSFLLTSSTGCLKDSRGGLYRSILWFVKQLYLVCYLIIFLNHQEVILWTNLYWRIPSKTNDYNRISFFCILICIHWKKFKCRIVV